MSAYVLADAVIHPFPFPYHLGAETAFAPDLFFALDNWLFLQTRGLRYRRGWGQPLHARFALAVRSPSTVKSHNHIQSPRELSSSPSSGKARLTAQMGRLWRQGKRPFCPPAQETPGQT